MISPPDICPHYACWPPQLPGTRKPFPHTGHLRGWLPAGIVIRHRGAQSRRADQRAPRQAVRHREQARCRQHHRGADRGARSAGRTHHSRRAERHHRDQSGALQKPALRPAEGFRLHRADRELSADPRRESEGGDQEPVADLIQIAKEKPGSLTFASSGVGTSIHLPANCSRPRAGIQMTHIPYKGPAFAVTDIIAGHVDMIFSDPGTVVERSRCGQLRALASVVERTFPGAARCADRRRSRPSGYDAAHGA